MNILHLFHGFFGPGNGVDNYIKNFSALVPGKHFFAVPKGKTDGRQHKRIFELETLFQVPEIISENKIDFLIIHWTGAESFTDNDSIVQCEDRYISLKGKRFSLDYSPYSYLNVTGLFHPNDRKHKVIILSHTCYKLPAYMNKVNVDHIVHVSRAAEKVNDYIENDHSVIYPCIDPYFLSNNIIKSRSRSLRVGFLGRLTKYDPETYRFIKKEYGNKKGFRFIFAGEYKKMIDPEPPNNFVFPGVVDKKSFFNDIDVFLYCTRLDSFSLALLESLASGTPSICSDVVSELGKKGGALIYSNKDQIPLFLDGLKYDHDLRARLSSESKEKVKRYFSPAAMVAAWVALLKRVEIRPVIF